MKRGEVEAPAVAELDTRALEAWMDSQALGAGPLEQPEKLAGGTQNILVRFRRADREYVFRRPPLHLRPASNTTMRREARVLRALADTPVPHPRLIASCEDETVLGCAFYLMEPVQGFNPTTGLPEFHAASPCIRQEMGLQLIDALIALGNLDHHALGLNGFGKTENYLERQVDRWRSQLESYAALPGWDWPTDLPVESVGEWLTSNRPSAFVPGLMHGDFQLSNVMYDWHSPRLAAIVDWELATIGDPLLDLAWLLATWPQESGPAVEDVGVEPWHGFPTSADLVARYESLSPRSLQDLDWYFVLACYKLGIILEGTHARARAGQAERAKGELFHAKAAGLFARAMTHIK